jgi:hypothetical protein
MPKRGVRGVDLHVVTRVAAGHKHSIPGRKLSCMGKRYVGGGTARALGVR